MDQPTTPFFLFDQKKRFIDLCERIEFDKRVSQLALVDRWDLCCLIYDSAGNVWEFRFRHAKEYSSLAKLLAQFYNPVKPISLTWHQHRTYELSELQKAYLEALAHDDDILTQFVEEDELRKRIEQSANFSELLETWRWMNTDHD